VVFNFKSERGFSVDVAHGLATRYEQQIFLNGGHMPLNKSGSKKAVGENIKKEEAAGKPHKQAVAIALETQRQAKKGKSKNKDK
jgi:hypothetical protein